MVKESWMQSSNINPVTKTDYLASAPSRSDQRFARQRVTGSGNACGRTCCLERTLRLSCVVGLFF